MAIHYKMPQNNIKSSKMYGKWYAHAVKQGEMTLRDIEQQIQERCSLKASDVRAAVAALKEVVEEGLKNGMVVNLDELGKLYLSIQSECVDRPEDFSVERHVRGIICKYTPEGHRSKLGNGRLVRPFTNDCDLEAHPLYNPEKQVYKQLRKGGAFRKG